MRKNTHFKKIFPSERRVCDFQEFFFVKMEKKEAEEKASFSQSSTIKKEDSDDAASSSSSSFFKNHYKNEFTPPSSSSDEEMTGETENNHQQDFEALIEANEINLERPLLQINRNNADNFMSAFNNGVKCESEGRPRVYSDCSSSDGFSLFDRSSIVSSDSLQSVMPSLYTESQERSILRDILGSTVNTLTTRLFNHSFKPNSDVIFKNNILLKGYGLRYIPIDNPALMLANCIYCLKCTANVIFFCNKMCKCFCLACADAFLKRSFELECPNCSGEFLFAKIV